MSDTASTLSSAKGGGGKGGRGEESGGEWTKAPPTVLSHGEEAPTFLPLGGPTWLPNGEGKEGTKATPAIQPHEESVEALAKTPRSKGIML